MPRLLSTIFAFFLFCSTISIAFASPPAPIPKTGQTTCFDTAGSTISCAGTGQDGELQTGVAWPNPRFSDNGDQSVTDNLTGLVWTKDANLRQTRDPSFGATLDVAGIPMNVVTVITWQQALDYIKKLNTENYLGNNDWRLPNINELDSLVNKGQAKLATQAAWLIGQGFSNVQADVYCSSSSTSFYSWGVKMDNYGTISGGSNSLFYVWPVRSRQLAALTLPKTGITDCYYVGIGISRSCIGTGQDGELQSGVAWPNPLYTDNSLASNTDKTVTDNLTGLIWSKDANLAVATKTWQQSLDYINSLNGINYAGHNDWRLPNINELASLIKKAHSAGIMDDFSNIKMDVYWSSTTGPAGAFARSVDISYGTAKYTKKTDSSYVWPVRGGQAGTSASPTLSVAKSGTGSGTVTSSTGGIDCGSTCSASLNTGTSVTLTAASSNGSTFTGWTGACSGTGTCTVTMDTAKSVTATFALSPTTTKPGDCDSNGTVTIAEVQSAINMFLGLKTVEACVDQDNNSSVSIAEVQKVINSFLGL